MSALRGLVEVPIVQAPMAGISLADMVSAVSGAGGLGSLGCYHLEPAAIRSAAADIRRLTAGPFNLNLWIPRERETSCTRVPAVCHGLFALCTVVR